MFFGYLLMDHFRKISISLSFQKKKNLKLMHLLLLFENMHLFENLLTFSFIKKLF